MATPPLDLFAAHAAANPDKLAVIDDRPGRPLIAWSFAEPVRLVCQLPDAVKARDDRSPMQRMIANAAPWSFALKEMYMRDFGDDSLWEVYGSTELGVDTVLRPEDQRRKPGSCGRAAPGVEAALFDDEGNRIGSPRVPGELFVRSRSAFRTDHKAQDKFEKGRRGDWLPVGDVAYFDEEGFVYICDRKNDRIVSGGMDIHPAEIEAARDLVRRRDPAQRVGRDPEEGAARAVLGGPAATRWLSADRVPGSDPAQMRRNGAAGPHAPGPHGRHGRVGGTVLSSIRVLEICDEAGFLAGKILGDLGADVVKIEPPGGDLRGRRPPYLGGVARSRAQPGVARAQRQQARHHARSRSERRARRVAAAARRGPTCCSTPSRPARSKRGGSAETRWHEPIPAAGALRDHPVRSDGTACATAGERSGRRGDGRQHVDDRRPRSSAAALHAADLVLPRRARSRARRADGAAGARSDGSRAARRRVAARVPARAPCSADRRSTASSALLAASQRRAHRPHARDLARARRLRLVRPARRRRRACPACARWSRGWSSAMPHPPGCATRDWEALRADASDDEGLARLEAAFGAFFASRTMRELYEGALDAAHPARTVQRRPRDPRAPAAARSRDSSPRSSTRSSALRSNTRRSSRRRAAPAIGIRRRAPRIGEHNDEIYRAIGTGARSDRQARRPKGVI